MFDDPGSIPTEHLEHEITTLAAQIYAATCRWLCLIAEFDRRECHLSWGFHSATAWLAWTCGLTARAAREHVRVARDLAELPLIRESFGRGELSYSKVRALTRVAVVETEEELLELAHNATAAQLERAVRAYRSAVAVAENRPPPDTFFAWAWEDDGTLAVRGRLAGDEGALLIEAMHHGHQIAAGRAGGGFGDGSPPPAQHNSDALAAVCEASLVSTGSSSGGDRYQVVVHLDQSGRCELEQGSTLGIAAAGRVLCDASVVAIADPGALAPAAGLTAAAALTATAGSSSGRAQERASAGRRTRTISASLRRVLRARDRGCRFPGCTHERFVDAHHIAHWADGGETSAENLVSLCRRHHRLIHEGRFTVGHGADGELEFRRRDGSLIRSSPLALRGDPSAITTTFRKPPRLATGDPLDLDLTVECMIQRAPPQTRADRAPAAA